MLHMMELLMNMIGDFHVHPVSILFMGQSTSFIVCFREK